MPRGSKEKYTDKQKRQAEHIAQGYKKKGLPADDAKRIAWSYINKEHGGGKKSGSGRLKRKTILSTIRKHIRGMSRRKTKLAE